MGFITKDGPALVMIATALGAAVAIILPGDVTAIVHVVGVVAAGLALAERVVKAFSDSAGGAPDS